MIWRLTDFINARLQRGLKRVAAGEPFQRLSIMRKTVETVLRSFHRLHLVEAKC